MTEPMILGRDLEAEARPTKRAQGDPREVLAVNLVVHDDTEIPGHPSTTIRGLALTSRLAHAIEAHGAKVDAIGKDPTLAALPSERERQVRLVARKTLEDVGALRDAELPKLEERLAQIIKLPEREALPAALHAGISRQVESLDMLQVEVLYTDPKTPAEVAATIEQMAPLINPKTMTVTPRISDEARFRRAWSEATPEAREIHEGLRQMHGHLQGIFGGVEQALRAQAKW